MHKTRWASYFCSPCSLSYPEENQSSRTLLPSSQGIQTSSKGQLFMAQYQPIFSANHPLPSNPSSNIIVQVQLYKLMQTPLEGVPGLSLINRATLNFLHTYNSYQSTVTNIFHINMYFERTLSSFFPWSTLSLTGFSCCLFAYNARLKNISLSRDNTNESM